jgi:hypothetical protein
MKETIDDMIINRSNLRGIQESNDSTPKKLIYVIPFDQQAFIPAVLKSLEDSFPEIYVDIQTNSLEDAYVNIAKAEEKLHEGGDR